MKKYLALYILLFTLSFNFALAEEVTNPNPVKGNPEKRMLLMESKRDLRIQDENYSKPEKVNLIKTFKNENANDDEGTGPDLGRGKGLPSCSETKDLMEKRSQTLNSNLEKRKTLLVKIRQLLNARIDDLASKGSDVTSIRATLESYVVKSEELFAKREALISSLVSLMNFDCISDPKNFKNNLKEFNMSFRNQNLEFNKLNRDLRLNVFYQINSLQKKGVVNSNSAPQN